MKRRIFILSGLASGCASAIDKGACEPGATSGFFDWANSSLSGSYQACLDEKDRQISEYETELAGLVTERQRLELSLRTAQKRLSSARFYAGELQAQESRLARLEAQDTVDKAVAQTALQNLFNTLSKLERDAQIAERAARDALRNNALPDAERKSAIQGASNASELSRLAGSLLAEVGSFIRDVVVPSDGIGIALAIGGFLPRIGSRLRRIISIAGLAYGVLGAIVKRL